MNWYIASLIIINLTAITAAMVIVYKMGDQDGR